MATPKFALDDIVFAKLKGWPAWPAKVEFFENIPSKNKIKYNVYFYGTNQIAQCKEEDLFPYIEYRRKLGNRKKNKDFMKAISQADAEVQKLNQSALPPNSNSSTLDSLKVELQVLKLDKDIKDSLNRNKPHFGTCLRLLEEYSVLNLTSLIYVKNPELISTLANLQVYSRNVSYDNDKSVEDKAKRKMYIIRAKARHVYQKVASLFFVPEGKTFLECFTENLIEFKESVKNMTESEILQLTNYHTF